jgi:Ser/Thr protein kinase RdoA (MazF antagonist)
MMAKTDTPTADGPLGGGAPNRGRVIKMGNVVRRPSGAHSRAVHALLGHLARSDFQKAPRPVALEQDTEVLTFLEGAAALEPLPAWSLTDDALVSVGRLLNEYHQCVSTFDATSWTWQRLVPSRWRGPLVTHNDTHPANVIFRHGQATGLIDFDLAAPGCIAWELAIAACFWVPLRSPIDVPDIRQGHATSRFHVLLDGYGAAQAMRSEVVTACADANRWIAAIIEEGSRQGHPAFGPLWADHATMFDRAHVWLAANEADLARATR